MRCVDVNVLVYAHRSDVDRHRDYLEWLEAARSADEPLGILDLVLSGFVRVVTHPRIFTTPTPLTDALAFVELVRGSPSTVRVEPGPRHWSIFSRLCASAGATGNLVPDAYLAAAAIETGATWVTADRGFARFAGITVEHPLNGRS